ncbi:hypothetical protein SPRG_08754 [Saprolegnia parasitica CBS 223.65]|uniref:Uncharacterized protein n=1 Tax=Saprolegnia parasitica (strain CBS 223.65) TaxID=695850 RepID=A0A067CGZ8_SAPPC|nr:hypothetical protein SPRG_08754 [Saprolegnia parasitica CBS 223.65]KDO25811.1 hypothetical protein SPRG_08754 [Saprolegnia parasitica CBS 223.65]|eukprot:XP_012203376.1 hypothetical protein SPRG_08754 [Saprolegnia parasitica CBS 223.65]
MSASLETTETSHINAAATNQPAGEVPPLEEDAAGIAAPPAPDMHENAAAPETTEVPTTTATAPLLVAVSSVPPALPRQKPQKRVQFASPKRRALSYATKATPAGTTPRRFPIVFGRSSHRVVVTAPIEQLVAAEAAYTLPPMAPLLWKERFALGYAGTKRVLALRASAPIVDELTFSSKDAGFSRPLVLALGAAYCTTITSIAMPRCGLDSATALALFRLLKSSTSISSIDVSDNGLGDDDMPALCAALRINTSLTRLVLTRNGLSARSLRCLALALQDNMDGSLLSLDLSYNPLLAASSQLLADCLSVNETLTSLNVAATHVVESIVLSGLWRNYTLHELQLQQLDGPSPRMATDENGRLAQDHLNISHAPEVIEGLRRATSGLAHCNLTGVLLPIQTIKSSRWIRLPAASLNELDGRVIAGLLHQNLSLLELDLASNHLGAESVAAIMVAMQACPTLRTVDLSDNGVGAYIGEALGQSLTANTTVGTVKVAALIHDVQQLRGNSDEVDELNITKEMLAEPLDFWIVTMLLGVNRRTVIFNELQIPPLEDHIDYCHTHLADYEASFLAVRIRHHSHLQVLQLNCCSLTSYAGVVLADALRNHTVLQHCLEHNHSLTHLNLSWNQLNNDGVLPLRVSLAANRALRRLDLRGNAISTIGIVAIGTGIAANACLEELYLRWNDVAPRGATSLATALTRNKNLRVLDIEQQHMEVDGAVAFAAMLRSNKALTVLNLRSDLVLHPTTTLTTDGATALAMALRENTTLKELNLAENRLTVEGCEALIGGVANLRLQKLDLSYSELTSELAAAFFAQLAHNTCMEELNVEHNNIGPDGFKACLRALCVNRTLRNLNIGYCHVTEEGMILVEKQARLFALLRLRLVGNRVTPSTKARLQALHVSVVLDI